VYLVEQMSADDIDSLGAQDLGSAPGHRIGVGRSEHHSGDTGRADGGRAGSRTSLVGTRFQAGNQRPAERRGAGLVQSDDLGMRAARRLGSPTSDRMTGRVQDNSADGGVRAGRARGGIADGQTPP
jgi:hypothetical protein